MTTPARKVFFAYPSHPAELIETIKLSTINIDAAKVDLTLWPQMDILGQFIPEVIRAEIQSADVLFADVTFSNPNVYYEIGYAIGSGKLVEPVINSSYDGAIRAIQKRGYLIMSDGRHTRMLNL